MPVLTCLRRAVRILWASPNTLVGLLIGVVGLCTGARVARVDGAVEFHGGLVTWLLRHATPLPGGALAMTLGHVILGVSSDALHVTRTHERVHVRQAERWGPLFLPAYLLASVIAVLRGKHFYRDNAFEREAYDQA